MKAIRKIVRRQGNTITIELPEDFRAETIEVILLPVDESVNGLLPKSENGLTELQKLLLKAPPMSDEELQTIEEKRNELNK